MPLRVKKYLLTRIKFICLLLFIIFCHTIFYAQTIYISTGGSIYRLDLEFCTYELVIDVTISNISDIAFHPDGTLFGINRSGDLFEIDTITGDATIVYHFSGLLFDALTSSNEGILYTADRNGEFWSYQKSTGIAAYLGNIGYGYAGDLAFYKGDLYMSSTYSDLIIRVDIDNPSNSKIVMTNAGGDSGAMYGIVTYAKDCNDVRFYGIVSGDYTIQEIDLDALTSDTVCILDRFFSGGATSNEFIASAPVKVLDTLISNPDCGMSNGIITLSTTGGTPPYEYSLNGSPFQDQFKFDTLAVGEYQIVIIDSRGCSTSVVIDLIPEDILLIDTIQIIKETCDHQNGQINITPIGNEPVLYSIDGLNFQSSNMFDSLGQGIYEITISDVAGCLERRNVEIQAIPPTIISGIQITPTSCGQTNGAILILTQNGNNISYSINETNFQSENTFNQLTPGDYVVSILDENGCTDQDLVSVNSSAPLILDTIEINNPICKENNGSFTINIEGNTGQVLYSLNNGGPQMISQFIQLKEGIYTWSVVDEAGCTLEGIVELLRSETFLVESITVKTEDCGEKNGSIGISFENSNEHISIYLNGNEIKQNPITGLSSAVYLISLIDDEGCILDTTINITQRKCEIFIPNIFSPNGDGMNDYFRLTSEDFLARIKNYLIFDRWGGVVYSASDFQIENQEFWWNGTSNEKDVSPGTYIYYIVIEQNGGFQSSYSGDISLIR